MTGNNSFGFRGTNTKDGNRDVDRIINCTFHLLSSPIPNLYNLFGFLELSSYSEKFNLLGFFELSSYSEKFNLLISLAYWGSKILNPKQP